MKILAYDLDNGTTTATVVSETDISSYSTTTYDIEYAEGHLYTCADGKVSKFKVEGKTITHVFYFRCYTWNYRCSSNYL